MEELFGNNKLKDHLKNLSTITFIYILFKIYIILMILQGNSSTVASLHKKQYNIYNTRFRSLKL